jgi:hypothetical protein
MTHEDILRIVGQHWDREVEAGCGRGRKGEGGDADTIPQT